MRQEGSRAMVSGLGQGPTREGGGARTRAENAGNVDARMSYIVPARTGGRISAPAQAICTGRMGDSNARAVMCNAHINKEHMTARGLRTGEKGPPALVTAAAGIARLSAIICSTSSEVRNASGQSQLPLQSLSTSGLSL